MDDSGDDPRGAGRGDREPQAYPIGKRRFNLRQDCGKEGKAERHPTMLMRNGARVARKESSFSARNAGLTAS
jgi:hypothetical protein